MGVTAVKANNDDCEKREGRGERGNGIDIHPRVVPSNFSAVLAPMVISIET